MSNSRSRLAEFRVWVSTDLLIKYFMAQLIKPFTELKKKSRTAKSYRFAQMYALWPRIEWPRACNIDGLGNSVVGVCYWSPSADKEEVCLLFVDLLFQEIS